MRACCCRPQDGKGGLARREALMLLVGTTGTMMIGCSPQQGGGALASFVSPEEERQLGEQAFEKIKQEERVSGDAALQQRLRSVGRQIVEASRSSIPTGQWEFVVFAGDELNAFALPGGHVGFYEGIFRVMRNDAQVAAVLGHEVGHVIARHSAQRIGASQASQLGMSALQIALGAGNVGYANELAALLGAGVQYGVILPYSRAQELEADRLGLEYMARAGYDPAEALDFWQRMAASGGGKPPAFLSTHPSDAQRIEQLREALPRAQAIYRRG
ncbi:M48 family metallopeptidase (plasmid) [Geminicoccaceae bacterium 1502E]|nr:M48 family metallopeptidase [Geminicoccaceae bacterium 1502E]